MSTPSDVPEYPRQDEAARDGVGEEDNPIPPWFNVGFWGLIGFGIVYILYYTLSGWSSAGEYRTELASATERSEAARAELPTSNPYAGVEVAIAEGQQVFTANCVACHKPDGSGMIGPSLVDPYWKYGGDDADRFASVSQGRPGGMPGWGPILGSEKIWKVLAYVDTLPRSTEPGLGAPDYAASGN